MIISENIKNHFVKNFSLPLQVVTDTYFEYFINLYDQVFQTKQKLEFLIDCLLKRNNNEETLIHDYYKLKDNIIEDIQNTEVYKLFIGESLDWVTENNNNIPKMEMFTQQNVNKNFISIDLKNANFHSLLYFANKVKKSHHIFKNEKTYSSYLKTFTRENYFLDSKHLRQVIFGNCNPKRQQTIQKHIMNQLLNLLVTIIPKERFTTVSSDEIVISKEHDDDKKKCLDILKGHLPDTWIRVSEFTLRQIENKPYYVKTYPSGDIEFKSVPAHYFAQVYKRYFEMPIMPVDKTFVFEKQLSVFVDPLFK